MARKRLHEHLNGMAISDTSIRQPVFITMLMLLAIVVGLLAYTRLPVSLLPDFAIPVVAVSVDYDGAGPESVAEQVSRPLEESLNTISGVKRIQSTSSEGNSQVTVEFNDSVSRERSLQDVREAVNRVRPTLPEQIKEPVFQQFSVNDEPILRLALSGQALSALELRRLADREFAPALRRVDGVGVVNVSGGQKRQINVQLDPARLQSAGIAPAQVSNAIRAANSNAGLGNIDTGEQRFNLRVPSLISDAQSIERLPISGTPYRVVDVANVEDGVEVATEYARLNGQDAITIDIVKRTGANTVSVAAGAQRELDRLFALHPNIAHDITSDDAKEVRSAISSSIEEMVLAVIAALLVVLLFFRDLRNTLVTMAGLPIILICTFAAMWLFGLNLNILSLLALSLSVGLVIDDAIVVRENIFRYVERGASPAQASSKGTAEVSLSVLAMTLTIIAVFLPVAFTSGTTGIIFKSFGITVACAMALSLVEAFTFAPMLSANLFKGQTTDAAHTRHNDASDQPSSAAELPHEAHEDTGPLGRFYGRVLGWSLRYRAIAVVVSVSILVATVVVASGLRFTFLPAVKTETITAQFESPSGTSLTATDALARRAEAVIRADPDVVALQTQVGAESATFAIKLRSSALADAARERLRPQLAFLPRFIFSRATAESGDSTAVTNRAVQVVIRSARPVTELAPLVSQVEKQVRDTPGAVDVGTNFSTGQPEVQFTPNLANMQQLGITTDDLNATVGALINGDTATTLRANGRDTDVVVRLAAERRADIASLNALTIPTTASEPVLLSSVVRVDYGTGPSSINRTNGQNEIVVGANIAANADQAQVAAQIETALPQIARSPDVLVALGGQQQEDQDTSFQSLFVAMGLSVLFVYMVLASQFGSFGQPLVIMLAMPFSFGGAFAALRLSGLPLDITAMIGLIMLLGLVTKNSILLVDFANQLRDAGMDKHAALERAGAVRLRPILMTSLAIIAGAIPTATGIHFFSESAGVNLRQSLAIVLIGGMITSTLLTLLIVPTAYSLLDSLMSFLERTLRRPTADRPPTNGETQTAKEPQLRADEQLVIVRAASSTGAHDHDGVVARDDQ